MKVSICIPAYNAARTIEPMLRSILAQTYRDIDIAVVDNASTDATGEIARRFAAQDPRIRYLRFDDLVHAHANFTRCFKIASGELIGIFHADDVYHPEIVAREVAFLDARPDVAVVFTRGGRIDGNDKPLAPFHVPRALFSDGVAIFGFEQILRAVLQYANILLTPSAMVRTHIYRDEIGEWPIGAFGTAADIFVYFTIAQKHKLAILDRDLMQWRFSTGSVSFNYAHARRERHDLFAVLDHFMQREGMPFLRRRDRDNYEFLVLKDDINMAISHLLDGNRAAAGALMPRLVQPNIVAAALRHRRHVMILLAGYVGWILSFIPLGSKGRRLIRRLRFG